MEFAHNSWLDSQPPKRTGWSSRTNLTEAARKAVEAGEPELKVEVKALEGHPWMMPFDILDNFSKPVIIDGEARYDDLEDIRERSKEMMNAMLQHSVDNAAELGLYDWGTDSTGNKIKVPFSDEKIMMWMSEELVGTLGFDPFEDETLDPLSVQETAEWRKNIRTKGIPANENWIFVAEAVLTINGIDNPEDLTEEQAKTLIDFQGKLVQFRDLETIHQIVEFLKDHDDVRKMLVLTHDGWRENFHSQVDFYNDFVSREALMNDPSEAVEPFLNEVKGTIMDLAQAQSTDNLAEKISSVINSMRKKAQDEAHIASESTFMLMIDITKLLQKCVETGEVGDDGEPKIPIHPQLKEAIQSSIADMIYNIHADANPDVITALTYQAANTLQNAA
jgi:hypothetical protein